MEDDTRSCRRGENGEDYPEILPTLDYQRMYHETLVELEVQKNNLMSASRVLRTTQDELEKLKDTTCAVAT